MSNTKKAKPKRLLSLFLALTMVLGLLPAMSLTAFAYSGSGTEDDPYIVTDYEELRSVMQSTPDYDTRYIKLGEDITNSTNVSKNALDLTSPYQTVILDLNGYTLKRAESATDWGVFMLSIGNLTIQDSSSAGTGKVVSEITGATYKNAIYVSSSGNLSIEGGTFESTESAIRTQGGTTVINGGTYRTSYVSALFQSGTVTVNGGSFSGTNGSAIAVNSDADVTINGCTASGEIGVNGGGSIWNFIPTTSTVTVNGAAVNRTGDTLSGEIIITKNVTTDPAPDPGTDPGSGSGTQADPYVATTYDELKTLVQGAPVGAKSYIKLGADVVYGANSGENDNNSYIGLKADTQNVVLDLNGHTITNKANVTYSAVIYMTTGSLTIKDSSPGGTGGVYCEMTGNDKSAVHVSGSITKLTIDGGTYKSNVGSVIRVDGGAETVINGGTFRTTGEQHYCALFYSGPVTVNGGIFYGCYTEIGNLPVIFIGYDNADVNLYGCIAYGDTIYMGGSSISDGYVKYTDTINGEKAIVVSRADGSEKYPLVIDGNYYQSELLKWVREAPTDGTTRYIKLAADIKKTEGNGWCLDLKHPYQKVVLDLNGHTITSSGMSTDWGVVELSIGSLTIRDSAGGGAIIAGHSGPQYVNALYVSSAGHLTVDGGTFKASGNNGTAIFTQGGTTVINGGTFESEKGWVAWFDSGTVTLNGGYYIPGGDTAIYFHPAANVMLVSLTAKGKVTKGGENVDIRENLAEGSTTNSSIYHGQIETDSSGLVVITGSPKISNVAITGVVAPVAGETPSNSVGSDTVLEHCSIDKYIGGEHVGENTVEWYDVNTMNPVDTFEAGRLYMVTIRLVADEGFSFSTKAAVYETLTVNGDDDAFVWKVLNNGKYAYIGYIFEAVAAGDAVKTVDISVDDHFTDYMTAGPAVTVSGSNFSSDLSGLWHTWNDKDLSDTNKSVAGMSYYKTITLTATGDYKFNVATAVNVTGGGKLNYNNISEDGKTMTVSVKATATDHEHDYGLAMKYNSSNHWYECSICGEKKDLGSHSLKYYSTGAGPAPGTTVTFTCHCGYSEPHTMPGTSVSEFYAVAVRPSVNMALIENSVYLKSWWAEVAEIVPGSIKWYKNDETTPLPVGYIFRSGEDYKVTVQFKAKDGYSFKDSMTGDGSGAWYEKGIDILSTYNYNTEVSADNRYVTATGYYKSTSVGVAHTVSAALPTFTPGDKFSDAKYDYNSIFTVDGAASSIGTVSVVFDDATTMVKYDASNGEWKAYTSSGGWIDYTGTKTLDELLTIQKGVEYEIYFRDQTSTGHYDSAKSREITDPGNSLTREVHFYSYSDAAAAAKAIYFFDSDGQSGGVTVLGTATRFGSQTDDMTIQLIKSGESEAAYEAVVKGDAAGYSIAGVLPGTYTMKVMKKNHVTREYTVTVGSADVTQNVKIHLLGDINGDGSVDMKDWGRMRSHINETNMLTDDYALACADVIKDGKVDMKDWGRMRSHINEANPLW